MFSTCQFDFTNSFLVVLIVFVDGFIKPHTPGSLREPATTYLFPSNWLTLPLSFGLLMSPWGGHSVFPNIYRDMRHPQKFKRAVKVTFSFTVSLTHISQVSASDIVLVRPRLCNGCSRYPHVRRRSHGRDHSKPNRNRRLPSHSVHPPQCLHRHHTPYKGSPQRQTHGLHYRSPRRSRSPIDLRLSSSHGPIKLDPWYSQGGDTYHGCCNIRHYCDCISCI